MRAYVIPLRNFFQNVYTHFYSKYENSLGLLVLMDHHNPEYSSINDSLTLCYKSLISLFFSTAININMYDYCGYIIYCIHYSIAFNVVVIVQIKNKIFETLEPENR